MTNTSTTHTGNLVTGAGDDIEIDVELIGGRTLRLSADGSELGAWPVEDCHLEEDPERNGSFRIAVDGDDAVFTPTDPVSFRSLIRQLEGATAMTNADSSVETDVGTDVRRDGAADDPVAFLFGSSPPPVQVPSEAPEVDAPTADDDQPAAGDFARADAAPDHVPSVGESAPASPRAFDLPDDDVVIDGGAFDDNGGGDFDLVDEDTVEVEAAAGVAVADSVDDLFAAEPEPDDPFDDTSDGPDEALMVADAETGAGGGDESRGRFGGSALDRLSSAISSITSSETASEEDEGNYELGPNTVAEEVLSTQRSLRDHQLKDAVRGKRLKIAGWLVAAVAVVALFAFLSPRAIDFIQNYEGGAEPPPPLPVSETTVPTPTTTAVEETDSPEPAPVSTVVGGVETVFDRPAPEFVALWDSIAAPVDEVLEFEVNPVLGPFEEQFTPYLSFVGVVEPQGTIEEFSLVVDPSGPANYDRVGIQALGVAIAVVDPERSPDGRAALLGELGLNVRQPDLAGIDGSVESGGILYTLVYDEAAALLTLTVAPAG